MYMQSHSHCFNACLKGRFFNIMESKEYLKRSDTDDDARIDWGIIFCVLVLAVIGMTALYVALSHDNIVNPTKVLFSQAIWSFRRTIRNMRRTRFKAMRFCLGKCLLGRFPWLFC